MQARERSQGSQEGRLGMKGGLEGRGKNDARSERSTRMSSETMGKCRKVKRGCRGKVDTIYDHNSSTNPTELSSIDISIHFHTIHLKRRDVKGRELEKGGRGRVTSK